MKEANKKVAIRMAELSHELHELEGGCATLLRRLERCRSQLQNTAQRITAASASVDLLCEHVAEVTSALDELNQLEREVNDLAEGIDENERSANQMLFESDGLRGSVEEAEDELERLSAILEGKAKRPGGH